jgi:TolB-like protein
LLEIALDFCPKGVERLVQFQFEDCVLNRDRRELTRGVTAVSVGPQVFDLLLYLLENRRRLVTKDELLASVWGGRIVSESTLASHLNAVRKAVGDSGEEQRLIRTISRKGFRFVGEVTEAPTPDGPGDGNANAADGAPPLAPALPDRPSIAVMPFVNLSGDPEQDYFADGVVEDVLAALSLNRWLFVIDRNSSFTYRGQNVDVRRVGRELGVRYVLEGSIRRSAEHIRLTGMLVDATTRVQLCASRFEGVMDDLFALQDRMAASVAGAIAPKLEQAEIERSNRKPTKYLDAYDYFLRGMAIFRRDTMQSSDEALALFSRAIELDAEYPSAYGMAAWCYLWRKFNGWLKPGGQEAAEAARLARRAVELGKDDAVALARGGHALGPIGGKLDSCITWVDKALLLNPNLSSAWSSSGFQRISRGEPEEALERFSRAMRLSPLDPEMTRMQHGVAMAHLMAGRFEEASSWANKVSRDVAGIPPYVLGVAAASHALAGRLEDAHQAMERLLRLNPALRISGLPDYVQLRRPQDLATFAEGLRRAGLPE